MLAWDEGLNVLAIGHANGFIECITVSVELGYTKYTQVLLFIAAEE